MSHVRGMPSLPPLPHRVAGNLALDLANTISSRGTERQIDHLADAGAVLAWATDAGLVDASFSVPTTRRAALVDDVHRLRGAIDAAGAAIASGEVASLAGVGLTWYTWFEQGRDIGVSEAFLLNVSKALKLGDAECCHLFLLAHRRPPPADIYQWPTVNPRIQDLMDDLTTKAAYVMNLRWDVVAWNTNADRLFGFAGRQREDRNFMRMVFADPSLRGRLPAFRTDGPKLIANFRYDLAVAPDDRAMIALVTELQRLSPDFRRWWDEPASAEYRRGVTLLADGEGVENYQHEMITVDEHQHLRMIVYFVEHKDASNG